MSVPRCFYRVVYCDSGVHLWRRRGKRRTLSPSVMRVCLSWFVTVVHPGTVSLEPLEITSNSVVVVTETLLCVLQPVRVVEHLGGRV